MNIGTVGNNFSPKTAGADQAPKASGSSPADIEQKIRSLEGERAQLEQQRSEEENPFAAQQSDNVKVLENRIKELDKQIQQLKAEAAKAQKNEGQNSPAASAARKFDTFEHSANLPKEPASGVYSVSAGENGNLVISLDDSQQQAVSLTESAAQEE